MDRDYAYKLLRELEDEGLRDIPENDPRLIKVRNYFAGYRGVKTRRGVGQLLPVGYVNLKMLKSLRVKQALTMNKVSQVLNISYDTYKKVEKGITQMSVQEYEIICELLNVRSLKHDDF